jgi:hypothetical protein
MRASWLALTAALAAALLAVSGCSSALPGPAPVGGNGAVQPAPHTVTAGLGGRSQAELDVVSGATTVTVRTANLGSELVSAATPSDSGVRPDLVVSSGTVQVFLDQTGQSGPAALVVLLNSGVTWRLVFSGGASQTAVDLGAGHFGGANFSAGSSLVTMQLPQPHGTVTIEVAGGASELKLGIPSGVPAQLRLNGGASSVLLGNRSYTGIAGGTVLTMPGWASATSRYEVYAPAGVAAVSVTS